MYISWYTVPSKQNVNKFEQEMGFPVQTKKYIAEELTPNIAEYFVCSAHAHEPLNN